VQGYRVELPEEQLEAEFSTDHALTLTPDLVGPSETKNAGIIGESVDMNLKHLGDVRQSTLLMELTKHLLFQHWREPGEDAPINLFGQLKRITRQWLDTSLECKGGTYPAQLMYRELADMACERITKGITNRELEKGRQVKAILDPFNPTGSTGHVSFNTSREDRWETLGPPPKNHVNWVILDSGWEGEFCRVAESHPKVQAYTKNHNLGLEVPYRFGSQTRRYFPDFIVKVDDGHGLLNLIVEVKGYRREDAKEKKSTMDTYWVPGVNHLRTHGRWAFLEFGDVYEMQEDFAKKVEAQFEKMIANAISMVSQGE
jgi:type III restriction enzyme